MVRRRTFFDQVIRLLKGKDLGVEMRS